MQAFAVRMAVLVIAAAAPAARALCFYDGTYNAKTSIPQEFQDSRWVVKAKVLSAKDGSSDGAAWSTYELKILHAYKGTPPRRLRFFTSRDSGGFYMDRPWQRLPRGHDIGGAYLLFLNPIKSTTGQPPEAEGAVFVNYNCGLSARWNAVGPRSRSMLARLERSR